MALHTFTRGANPKGLQGKGQSKEVGGEKVHVIKLSNREFFWDSVLLYVVSAIIGLTAIDLISEYIRGSGVECFSPYNETITDYLKYINKFCSRSIPAGEYFPTFIVIQGILIAAPHYLWLNQYEGRFEYFFSRAQGLVRSKEEATGRYPTKNYVFIQQLQSAFGTYHSREIFWWYVLKLGLQLLLSSITLGVASLYFTEFDENFRCPTRDYLSSSYWPLQNEVTCVFTSLRLLALIRGLDVFLLSLVVGGLTWALLWCFRTHKTELGSDNIAKFTFQSGLEPEHHNVYFDKLPKSKWHGPSLRLWFSRLCNLFEFRGSECVNSDLDFLTLRLFRADSGLGFILKDVQVHKTVQDLNDEDHNWVDLHRGNQTRSPANVIKFGNIVEKEYVKSDTQWVFDKEVCDSTAVEKGEEGRRGSKAVAVGGLQEREGQGGPGEQPMESPSQVEQMGVYNAVKTKRVENRELLVIPASMRGAVMGFAARSPANAGALTITFGTPSLGFAFALGRIFKRVGCAIFSPYYHNPSVEVLVESFGGANVHVATCAENFLAYGSSRYIPSVRDLWKSGIKKAQKTNFILVGPMTRELQKATVNKFLDMMINTSYLDDKLGCLLLIIQPVEIGGRNVEKVFGRKVEEDVQPAENSAREVKKVFGRKAKKYVQLVENGARKIRKGFLEYEPPKVFERTTHRVMVNSTKDVEHTWPPKPCIQNQQPALKEGDHSTDLEVWCGDTRCVYRFRVFEYPGEQSSRARSSAPESGRGGNGESDTTENASSSGDVDGGGHVSITVEEGQ